MPFSPMAMRSVTSPPGCFDPCDGQGIDETCGVDTAIRHVAGPRVARQVIQFVHIERAGKNAAQQSVGRRQIGPIGIDEVSDPTRIDTP